MPFPQRDLHIRSISESLTTALTPRAGNLVRLVGKEKHCTTARDELNSNESIFLGLRSSKKTYADSTSRQLRLGDHSHRYWRMGDGGRRLGFLLGTAGGR